MFNPDKVLHCIANSIYATYNHMGSTQLFQCITLSVSKKIKGKGIFTFLKRYFLKWTSHTLYGLLQALIKLSRFKGFTNNFASLDCFALFFVPLYYHIFMQLSTTNLYFFQFIFFGVVFLLLFFPDYYIQFISAFLFYGVYLSFKWLLLL